MHSLVRWLNLLYVAAAVALVLRLTLQGLHRRYRLFAGFLVVDLSLSLAGQLLAYNSPIYIWFWAATQPVTVALYFLIVHEMYSLVLHDYPGIAGLFRWLMRFAVPVAIGISVAPAIGSIKSSLQARYPVEAVIFPAERTADVVILVFLLVLGFLFLWFPLQLSRNTKLYFVGYLVFFTAQTAGFTLGSLLRLRTTELGNAVIQAVSCACLIFWAITLNRAGEERGEVQRAEWLPGEKEHIRQVLGAFDQVLSRSNRLGRN